MSRSQDWIESKGGPLFLGGLSVLRFWKGNQLSVGSSLPTDYQRACGISDEIGVIKVVSADALVLGDEPDRTTIVEMPSSNILLVRWRWAESEKSLLSAVRSISLEETSFRDEGVFSAKSEEYLLFDAACDGEQIDKSLGVFLKEGTYSLGTADFRPDKHTCALLHRLQPMR